MTGTAPAAAPEGRAVHGDGLDLWVTERGDPAATTVVLVHGYPDTSSVWDPVAERLAATFHVVTYDVRGAGRSEVPATKDGYRLPHLVADLGAVIDATSGGRSVHLVGHDWGSIQCWEAVTCGALDGRLASYTSVSGPSLDHVGQWLKARRSLNPRKVKQLVQQGVHSWYVYAFHVPRLPERFWRGPLPKRLGRVLEQAEGVATDDRWPSPTLASDGANGVNLYRANVLPRTSRPDANTAAVPVQLIVPTKDRFVTPSLLEGLEDRAPELWRREVPAEHWVVRSRPDAMARWITEFAELVGGGSVPAGLVRAGQEPTGPTKPWAGRVAVVTGAGSGIGRQAAVAFAQRGATVIVADRDRDGADRTVELCTSLGAPAEAWVVDVSDRDAMEAFAKSVEAEHGPPSIVVNNAGIGQVGSVLGSEVEDWERILGVNLWGVLHGSRLFGRQMARHGEGGHIVNIASAAAFTPSKVGAAYATTKAAVLMFTESLRAELAPAGIGVSAICPGFADTSIAMATEYVGASDDDQQRHREAADVLYKRRALTPEKVAKAILHAIDKDKPLVLVGTEAHLARAANRFAPGLSRRIATIDPTAR